MSSHHDLREVLDITLDVLIDIMQDEEATIKNRLDAAWTTAQLVLPRMPSRPFRQELESQKVGRTFGVRVPDQGELGRIVTPPIGRVTLRIRKARDRRQGGSLQPG